jgi:hypothetical protein
MNGQERIRYTTLHVSGIVLIVWGVLHIPLVGISQYSWEGPVSWRKPILFGLSTGLTAWSWGEIVRQLKPLFFDKWLTSVTGVGLVVEVGLITWQTWRGVPSHFNTSTPFDTAVDWVIWLMIVVAMIAMANWGLRYFAATVSGPHDRVLAYRGGIILFGLSCLIGFIISAHGYRQVAAGLSPELVGAAGVAKFPHGATIHALQMFPLAAWALRKLTVSASRRLVIIYWLIASQFGFLGYAIAQTWLGRSRFSPAAESAIWLAVALVCGFIAVIATGRAILRPQDSAADSFSEPDEARIS